MAGYSIRAATDWLARKFNGYRGVALERVDRAGLGRLRNSMARRRAFVIGNGPSLTKLDLPRLAGEVTIGSNGIFLLFGEMGFRPTFYTVEDTLVAEDRAATINALRGMTKIFPADLKYCLRRDPDTLFINFCRPGYAGFPRFTDRFERRVFWGGTVTYLNMQLAYFLGCRPIYLIGLDHHYEDPTAKDSQQGSVILSGSEDRNHFHPDYFGPGYRYHDPRVDRMEQAYREARRFLEGQGCGIFNATAGGRLEVFQRVRYEELFR